MPERTIWIAAGLLGLIIAVALAVLTSYVAQPPAGLTSEPISAGRQLAPARTTSTATPPPGAPPRRARDDHDAIAAARADRHRPRTRRRRRRSRRRPGLVLGLRLGL